MARLVLNCGVVQKGPGRVIVASRFYRAAGNDELKTSCMMHGKVWSPIKCVLYMYGQFAFGGCLILVSWADGSQLSADTKLPYISSVTRDF